MARTLAVLALLALAACRASTAPETPATPIVRYVPACVGVFALYRDGAHLGVFYFPPGAVRADTVTAGTHTVGYSRLDGAGWTLNADERTLDVRGVTDYPMACGAVTP